MAGRLRSVWAMSAAQSRPTNQGQKPTGARMRLPLLRVVILVIALLLIGEQFPFSYFPMYSSFDPEADYYYVADQAGEPYACVEIFGTSTANVKKMYRARLRELTGRREATEFDATAEERQQVGETMLRYLRELGARTGRDVPGTVVVLKRVMLQRDATGQISREEINVAEG